MDDFKKFKHLVQVRFFEIASGVLFRTEVTKDEMEEEYINSFEEGTNPVFRKRTEHDCQSCFRFIRNAGNVVAIDGDKLLSIWDIEIGGIYQPVADAMSALVKSRFIENAFFHYENKVGTNSNHEVLAAPRMIEWHHFYLELPDRYVVRESEMPTKLSKLKSANQVFSRALCEIDLSAAETVLELIEQGSIDRGDEKQHLVESFIKCKKEFDKAVNKDNFVWSAMFAMKSSDNPRAGLLPVTIENMHLVGIRTDVIGTLLVDISDDVDLDTAVYKFNHKMDPTKYQHPTTIATPRMIENGKKRLKAKGLLNSLPRRHATISDINITNVRFADHQAKVAMDVFDQMIAESPDKIGDLSKVDEVSIDTFMNDIVPKATCIEMLVENRHETNLMSLIAPINKDAKHMFKWDNNFSWAYNGDIADSMRERVRKAGGNVEGDLRCSLSWFNYDDLDIHLIEPDGNRIYHGNKKSYTGGKLDVDMNANGKDSRKAVENITHRDKNKMLEGRYHLVIEQYTPRESDDIGFDVEIEYGGTIHSFSYDKPMANKSQVLVAVFDFNRKTGIKFVEDKGLLSEHSTREMWGIRTQKFQRVSVIMNSPNHWDGNKTGNKHLFFILDGCLNDTRARGFFNEFLHNDLNEDRKVFEMLGNKMRAEISDQQLSGLGFSSTQRNHAHFKVSGSFNRIIKVNF